MSLGMTPSTQSTLIRTFTKVGARPVVKQRGSALLATLCFAAVLSLSLSSYLAVCYRSLVLSNRTMHSAHSIELAEVGMEEALWALNNTFDGTWSYTTPFGVPTATKTATGFAYENGAVGQVVVTIANYTTSAPQITTVGTISLSDHTSVVRTLQSDSRPAPLFTKAIGAVGNLTFNFGGTVDSYNSSIAGYTTTVPAHLTAGNSAAVISAPDMNIGTAQIYGFAVTNPITYVDPTPFLSMSGANVIGPGSSAGIDPSRRRTNFSQPVYDPLDPPGGTPIAPVTAATAVAASAAMAPGGVYRVDSVNLPDGAELVITSPVVLVVSNSVQTSDTGKITISGTGSLELQIDENDGQGLVLQGSGIVNQTGSPQKLSVVVGGNYAGNPTSSIDVTNDFYGSIYLPRDAISIANSTTIYGALVAKTVNFTGPAPAFHYDSAFQNVSTAWINAPFTLVQLRELSPSGP